MENKLPRAVIGILIGIAFGLSGALFQTMLRNPLASPDVIGISYGASAAAVTAIVVFGASGAAVSGCGLCGALAVAVLIYTSPRQRFPRIRRRQPRQRSRSRLILAGIGIAAALNAVVNFLMTRTDIRTAAEALIWLNGSLNSASWDRAGVLALALLVLVPAVAVLAGPLRILELGDDAAAGLGIRVGTPGWAWWPLPSRWPPWPPRPPGRWPSSRSWPAPSRAASPARPAFGRRVRRRPDRPGRGLRRLEHRPCCGRHRPARRRGHRCAGSTVPDLAAGPPTERRPDMARSRRKDLTLPTTSDEWWTNLTASSPRAR